MKQLRTVVADDNAGFRAALIALLRTIPNVIVVGEAVDGEEAIHCVDELDPDLLLLDLQMPKRTGWQVISLLQKRHARPRIIVLSSYASPHLASVVEERGLDAYLSKDNPQAIVKAITELAKKLDTADS